MKSNFEGFLLRRYSRALYQGGVSRSIRTATLCKSKSDVTELGIGTVYHARALEREQKSLSSDPAWSVIGAVDMSRQTSSARNAIPIRMRSSQQKSTNSRYIVHSYGNMSVKEPARVLSILCMVKRPDHHIGGCSKCAKGHRYLNICAAYASKKAKQKSPGSQVCSQISRAWIMEGRMCTLGASYSVNGRSGIMSAGTGNWKIGNRIHGSVSQSELRILKIKSNLNTSSKLVSSPQ
jgi:hypothetical protein